ncbi:dermokine isoform X3 [Marmota marmota marmota]|uniref:dermokine isoform X3 n=1 Tax=Marmota marmota marmota TaxID=9994 RepID=UPI002091EFEA|nr:dermokine isoform X3 [Marmota marmota marmota]
MKSHGSLACLLLALCLGSGSAGPLQGGGESVGQGLGDAISNGVGEAIGQGAKEAASSGIQDAIGQGGGEVASRTRELGDTVSHRLGEAARTLENTGNEAGRQVENAIHHGVDAARGAEAWGTSGGHGVLGHNQGNLGGPGSPWGQGHPGGSEGSFGTNSLGGYSGQGGSGGSQSFGTDAQGAVAQPGYGSVRGSSQNSGCTNPPPSGSGGSSSNSGGSSSSQSGSGGSSHGGGSSGGSSHSGSSSGNSGSGSSSGSSRERQPENSRELDQSFSVSKGSDSGPSSGSSSGGYKPECDNPGNEARQAGGSGNQESRENSHLLGGSNHQGQGSSGDSGRGDAVSGLNTVNSQTSSGLFNFDTFWKNFKSKMGFINWDAIEKGRVPSPSTRALLYFRRLWENFKQRTPFFNWKEITEDADVYTFQKRAGGADQFPQPGSGRQEVPAVTSKNYNYNQQAYPTAYYGQVKTPAKKTTFSHY